jgi:hypothetical protein
MDADAAKPRRSNGPLSALVDEPRRLAAPMPIPTPPTPPTPFPQPAGAPPPAAVTIAPIEIAVHHFVDHFVDVTPCVVGVAVEPVASPTRGVVAVG